MPPVTIRSSAWSAPSRSAALPLRRHARSSSARSMVFGNFGAPPKPPSTGSSARASARPAAATSSPDTGVTSVPSP